MHFRPTVIINLVQLGVGFALDAVDSVVHAGFDKAWQVADDLERKYL